MWRRFASPHVRSGSLEPKQQMRLAFTEVGGDAVIADVKEFLGHVNTNSKRDLELRRPVLARSLSSAVAPLDLERAEPTGREKEGIGRAQVW